MTEPAPQELTDKQKLVALETYIKFIKSIADGLRVRVTEQMGNDDEERVGAWLPDRTKLGAVTYSEGRRSVKLTDEDGALAWCERAHPEQVQTITIIRPAYRKKLLDVAGSLPVGSKGVDPATGEELPFIEVQQGLPFITVTSTKDGTERMAALAMGFPQHMLGSQQYDPDFADRLENGAYDR